jgi:hypothetical protein
MATRTQSIVRLIYFYQPYMAAPIPANNASMFADNNNNDYGNDNYGGGGSGGDDYNSGMVCCGTCEHDHWCCMGGNAMCAVGACFCPELAFAYNYVLATRPKNTDAYLGHAVVPFFCQAVADLVVWSASRSMGGPMWLFVPLGFVLRANHRQALFGHNAVKAAGSGEAESCAESIIVELLCWGCSLSQIHSHLRDRADNNQGYNLKGVDWLGTLYVPENVTNSMQQR